MRNKKLIAARNETGLTQVEVAEKAGTTERMYQRYEAGECLPKVDIAKRIAQILHKTVEDLF